MSDEQRADPINHAGQSRPLIRLARDGAQRVRQRAHARPALFLAPGGQLAEDVAELLGSLGLTTAGSSGSVLMR